MEKQKKIKSSQDNTYVTSDLHLQAFLRLKVPHTFIGVNKSNPVRVTFIFKKTPEILKLVEGYLRGKEYKLSPLAFSTNIDLGKGLIFGDFELSKQ